MGAALHRTLAEGARADGGRQHRPAYGRNAARWGHQSLAGEPTRSTCGWRGPIRTFRSSDTRTTSFVTGGASTMERACGSLRGLQVGPTSAEDEGCVLQGCDPAWRFSEPFICLPRVYVPSEESAGERRSSVCWLPARGKPESANVHQSVDPALGATPSQRQIPARFGQDVQSVHRRLDQLLRPVLPDAVAFDPEEDRCLCHPLGAPKIQTVASQDQRGARLV